MSEYWRLLDALGTGAWLASFQPPTYAAAAITTKTTGDGGEKLADMKAEVTAALQGLPSENPAGPLPHSRSNT